MLMKYQRENPRTSSLPMNPLATKDTPPPLPKNPLPTQEHSSFPGTPFLPRKPLFTHWQEPPSYPRSLSLFKNLLPTLPLSIPKPSPHQGPLAYLRTLSLPMLPSQSVKMRPSSLLRSFSVLWPHLRIIDRTFDCGVIASLFWPHNNLWTCVYASP